MPGAECGGVGSQWKSLQEEGDANVCGTSCIFQPCFLPSLRDGTKTHTCRVWQPATTRKFERVHRAHKWCRATRNYSDQCGWLYIHKIYTRTVKDIPATRRFRAREGCKSMSHSTFMTTYFLNDGAHGVGSCMCCMCTRCISGRRGLRSRPTEYYFCAPCTTSITCMSFTFAPCWADDGTFIPPPCTPATR